MFGYWPANPKEPILVDIGKVRQLLQFIQESSISHGYRVCGNLFNNWPKRKSSTQYASVKHVNIDKRPNNRPKECQQLFGKMMPTTQLKKQ
uniref:Uncharacterized protein n=1 Tax=Romanomermis culicivorax TaxID=13658 RepID=A0A915JFX8_ROMCU